MTKQKIVVALGGNAILSTDASAKAQQEALISTSKSLVKLIKEGHEVIVTHGNGPQVGNLLLQQAAADSEKNPAMPLDTCVAMTEGSIGFWLVNALDNELQAQGIQKEVAAVVTQVIVDAKDPAFENPTKPIGPFLTEEDAKNKWRSLVQVSKKMQVVAGVRLCHHQNQLVLKKPMSSEVSLILALLWLVLVVAVCPLWKMLLARP